MAKKNHRINIFNIICCVILSLYVFLMFAMILWAFINSFKGFDEFYDNVLGFPATWSLDNYLYVWENFTYKVSTMPNTAYIEDMFLNSLFYAFGCATVSVLVCSVTAYVVSQYKYKFSSVIYYAVIFCMVFPVVGSLPSEMQIVTSLGLRDKWIGMFVLKANFLGVYFLVFYETFLRIPKELREAAKIDGAGNVALMVRIYLPLVTGTLFTVWLIYFIQYWNDYQTLLLYLPSKPNLSYGLYIFNQAKTGKSVPQFLAAAILVFLPIMIIFIVFRKRLMSNISVSASVKG